MYPGRLPSGPPPDLPADGLHRDRAGPERYAMDPPFRNENA